MFNESLAITDLYLKNVLRKLICILEKTSIQIRVLANLRINPYQMLFSTDVSTLRSIPLAKRDTQISQVNRKLS